ncbi:MAG: tRNA (cytidine(34)-2'-O)-methyltransferase [Chlamydiales bacterium]
MKIILYQPEIPQNTGNVVRTCAVTGAKLQLIPPLGFSLSQRQIKRAGLDYWKDAEIEVSDHLVIEGHCFFFSTKGEKLYTQANYSPNAVLIFGAERAGLPQHFHNHYPEQFYRLPMRPGQRSLNLSNAVAIVVYEAWRQCGFCPL